MNDFLIRVRLHFGFYACVIGAFVGAPGLAVADEAATLIQTATSGTGQARYTAIDDLGERHTSAASAVPALQKLLKDKDAQVRWRSARALGDYGEQAKAAAGDLRALLGDSESVVQYHAAVALGRVGDKSEETIAALLKMATSKDPRVARAAIAALRALEPDREHVLKALGEILQSDDDAVVLHALEAIVERGADAVPLLNDALKRPETAYLACTAIEQIGPDAKGTVPALTDLLGRTKHSHLLIQALLAIASIGPDANSAAAKVVPFLDHTTDDTVPVAAAYALGSIGAKDAGPQLHKALESDNAFLQMTAAWALAKLNPDDGPALQLAVEKLINGLKSNDARIRTAAAKGLQALKAPPEVVQAQLVAVITDADPEVRENAISAIAGLGESVVPRVAGALKNEKLRSPAVQVLRKLGPKAAGAVPQLIEAAANAEAKSLTEIQLALGAIGPAAAPATEMLAKSIDSSDAGERESALYALRQIGPKAGAATRPLFQRMNKDDTFDAYAAAWALARIAPANPTIAGALVPKLQSGLANADETVRMQSAAALGDMGAAAKGAAPALDKAAKDDSSAEVRTTAAEALERIRS